MPIIISGRPGQGVSVPSTISAVTQNAGSGAQNLDLAGRDYALWKLTLNNASVALSIINWPAAPVLAEVVLEITQDATGGRDVTFPSVTEWADSIDGLSVPPVIPKGISNKFTIFITSSDAGTTQRGAHAQRLRTHIIPAANPTGADLDYFENYAKILKVRPVTGGTGTGTTFDLNKGTAQGASSTLYTTQANRPTVASGNRTNTSVTLPDTVLISPGDYLSADIDVVAGATAAMIEVTTIEA